MNRYGEANPRSRTTRHFSEESSRVGAATFQIEIPKLGGRKTFRTTMGAAAGHRVCAFACLAALVLPLAGCQSIDGNVKTLTRSLRGQTPAQKTTLTRRPGNKQAQAFIQRARKLYRRGSLKAARSALQSARRIDSYRPATYEAEAQIALDMGDREGYLAAMNAILAANPKSAKLHNSSGKGLVQAKQIDVGIAALEKAVRLSTHDSVYSKDLAAALAAHGRSSDALKALVTAVKHNPSDKSLLIALARLNESAKNWKTAAMYYERVLRGDPHNLMWQRRRARCLYQMQEFASAYEAFARCFGEDVTRLSIAERIEYGDACLRLKRYEEAQKVFDEISADSSKRLKDVELLRGMCALYRGRTIRARGIFNTALTHWPQDEDLLQVLELCSAADAQ